MLVEGSCEAKLISYLSLEESVRSLLSRVVIDLFSWTLMRSEGIAYNVSIRIFLRALWLAHWCDVLYRAVCCCSWRKSLVFLFTTTHRTPSSIYSRSYAHALIHYEKSGSIACDTPFEFDLHNFIAGEPRQWVQNDSDAGIILHSRWIMTWLQ